MAFIGQHTSPETEFKSGADNPNFGKQLPKTVREKIGFSLRGEKNGRWKGDKVGYASLHQWIKDRKPKPEFCEKCGIKKAYDLANISGEYKRNINDFEWLCRSCHMRIDGRIKNSVKRFEKQSTSNIISLIKQNQEDNRKCPSCQSFYVVKRGFINGKTQRYGCRICGIRFI